MQGTSEQVANIKDKKLERKENCMDTYLGKSMQGYSLQGSSVPGHS